MVEGCCVISKNSQGLPVYEDLQPLFWKVSIISLQTPNVYERLTAYSNI